MKDFELSREAWLWKVKRLVAGRMDIKILAVLLTVLAGFTASVQAQTLVWRGPATIANVESNVIIGSTLVNGMLITFDNSSNVGCAYQQNQVFVAYGSVGYAEMYATIISAFAANRPVDLLLTGYCSTYYQNVGVGVRISD